MAGWEIQVWAGSHFWGPVQAKWLSELYKTKNGIQK